MNEEMTEKRAFGLLFEHWVGSGPFNNQILRNKSTANQIIAMIQLYHDSLQEQSDYEDVYDYSKIISPIINWYCQWEDLEENINNSVYDPDGKYKELLKEAWFTFSKGNYDE